MDLVLVVAGVLFLGLIVLAVRPREPLGDDSRRDPRYIADHRDPMRNFIHGILAAYKGLTGDPGYWHPHDSHELLTNGWGTEDRSELVKLIQRYRTGEINLAFDKARIVYLARLGASAGWLSETDSWTIAGEAAEHIRHAFRDWVTLHTAVWDGVFAWYKGKPPKQSIEFRPVTLEMSRKYVWTTTPYPPASIVSASA